jgi:HTH-type transcriptional regulator, sugar sensing transcriptional regulator
MRDLKVELQELGLTGREAEVYLALLQKKELSAPEVGKITTITRTKAYELLQNLVKKGICNETYKNGNKVFCSVDPNIAIQNMLAIYENELNKKKKIAEYFREDLIELYSSKEKNEAPLDYIEVLSDIRQIADRWAEIQKNTKKEILVFSKPPYTGFGKLEDNIKKEAEVLKSNIIGKSIYEYGNLKSPEEIQNLIETIEIYQSMGEESRIIEELPMKLVVSDEIITMLSLNDRVAMSPTITTMIVDHPDYARALKTVFNTYWAGAMSIEEFKKDFNNKERLL